MGCAACGRRHSGISAADTRQLIERFQEGDGHRVTRYGVFPVCLLEILNRDTIQSRMENKGNVYDDPAMHDLLSAIKEAS